jgi:hypothetical protein
MLRESCGSLRFRSGSFVADEVHRKIRHAMKPGKNKKERTLNAAIAQDIGQKRNYLYSNYNLSPDQKMRAEMLFADMERVGMECRDLKEFEYIYHNRTLSRELYRLMLDNGHCLRSTWMTMYPEPKEELKIKN